MTLFLTLQIIILFILLMLSAFFSGSETALTKLSKIKVKHWIYTRAQDKDAWINWLSKPQDLISTILIGNTLVNIFFSSLMAALAMLLFKDYPQKWVQGAAGISAFFLLLIFGEIVPKIYCRQNPEKISSLALGPLFQLSKFLAAPLEKFLGLAGKIFPIFKQPTPGRISALSLDEIRALLLDPLSVKGLEKESWEMMRRVLESHHIKVSEIMTPWQNVEFLLLEEALAGGMRLERFLDCWVESGHSRMPVVRGLSHPGNGNSPQIVGYLYFKDLLASIAQETPLTPSLCQKWIRPMPAISPEKTLLEILDLFKFGAPITAVLDGAGNPLGIVTLEDILEEFVGEILDEYDLMDKT